MKSVHLLIGLICLSIAIIIHGLLNYYAQELTQPIFYPNPIHRFQPPVPFYSQQQPIQPKQHFDLNAASPTVIATHNTTWGANHIVLAGFSMNGKGNTIIVAPDSQINATSAYTYDCPTCQAGSINQIIVGIAGVGAQACIYNGSIEGGGIANFALIAPKKPGIYDVRFRYAQDFGCSEALAKWWDRDGAPAENTTVGRIIVK